MYRLILLFCSLSLVLLLEGCNKSDMQEVVEYTGPLSEAEDVEMYYSEKAQVKVKMTAKKVFKFKNEDQEFPEGIYMEFYNEFGRLQSTLRANHAYYFKDQKQWRGRGDVEVKNLEKNEQLNTEELFWKPADQRIFTDKFVTIRQQSDVIYGEGLEAKEDLSDYTITKLSGSFEVEE